MTRLETSDPASAGRFVGQSVTRREDRRLLTGHGGFTANVTLPGMLSAAFVRSDVARGRIVNVDVTAALNVRGVRAVFTAADFDTAANQLRSTLFFNAPNPPARPLAAGDVRFVGEPVALVVADDAYAAADAAALVDVGIETLPPVLDLGAAMTDAELVHAELGTNCAGTVDTLDDAAWEQLCASAAHVVSRTFTSARAAHAPMEGRAIVASWDPWKPEFTIWSSTQNTHEVRAFTSRLLGVPEHQVRAISNDVGGGFGQKIFVTPDEACVMLAAHRLQRPVRWIETRSENLLAAGHGRRDEAAVDLALDADGAILGMRVDHLEDVGAFPVGGTGSSTGTIPRLLPGPYKVPVVQYRGRAVYTSTCGRSAYRGPWLMETLCREQILDQAGIELGVDALELRRRNVIPTAEVPYTTATGLMYKGITPAETLEQAAEILDYAGCRTAQQAARADGRLVGIGLAMFVEPNGIGAGPLGSDQATIRVAPSGSVDVYMGTGSTGNSLETTIPQIVADHLGCALDDVVFHQGDTAATPYGHGSGGSRAAVVSGGAARESSLALREHVLAVAAHMLEASPGDLDLSDGVISVVGTPSVSSTLADVAAFVYHSPERLPGDLQGLEASVRYNPPDVYTWSNACHACLVEVDRETGAVDVQRFVVSEDCGTLINPMIVEGQIAGGVIQGIGGALFEDFRYDADGNPLTSTFADYLIPSATEVPRIEYGHVETPSASSGGYKGMGEGGAIGSPSAVANAIADALAPITSDGVTTFPLSPARIAAIIAAAGAEATAERAVG